MCVRGCSWRKGTAAQPAGVGAAANWVGERAGRGSCERCPLPTPLLSGNGGRREGGAPPVEKEKKVGRDGTRAQIVAAAPFKEEGGSRSGGGGIRKGVVVMMRRRQQGGKFDLVSQPVPRRGKGAEEGGDREDEGAQAREPRAAAQTAAGGTWGAA